MYLKAWNTQESIADVLGVSQAYVNKIITNCIDAKYDKDFEPYLYNIWNLICLSFFGKMGSEKSTILPFWWTFSAMF